MNSALERLLGLRVEDVMNGEVAALSETLRWPRQRRPSSIKSSRALLSSTSKAVVWEC